jgi:hypothetical protein
MSWYIQRKMRDGKFIKHGEGYANSQTAKAAAKRESGGYFVTWRVCDKDAPLTYEANIRPGERTEWKLYRNEELK